REALRSLERRLAESQEQHAATAAILQVIAGSSTDARPAFDAIVASAAKVCGVDDVLLLLRSEGELRRAAGLGMISTSVPEGFVFDLTRGSVAGRAMVDQVTLHIHDLAAESPEEFPVGRAFQRRFGHRAMLAVPLRREGVSIGVICVFRVEPRPFPEEQI